MYSYYGARVWSLDCGLATPGKLCIWTLSYLKMGLMATKSEKSDALKFEK